MPDAPQCTVESKDVLMYILYYTYRREERRVSTVLCTILSNFVFYFACPNIEQENCKNDCIVIALPEALRMMSIHKTYLIHVSIYPYRTQLATRHKQF